MEEVREMVQAFRSSWPGSATARPFLVYMLVILAQVWLGYSLQGLSQEGNLGSVLILAVLLAVGLLPAMVLSWALVARDERPRIARLMLGAGCWAGWGLLIFATAAIARTVVLDVAAMAVTLLIFGIAGAVFVDLGLSDRKAPPGRAFLVVAASVAAAVLIGAISTAGLWGSAV
jgi:hypothetical protein